MKKIAVVLMSGGMDSALTAAIAKNDGYRIAALHLNYGQRTQKRELKAFEALASHYDAIARLVVDVAYFSQIGGSSLTSKDIAIPTELAADTVPNTYVPFRNANILAIATSWAEVLEAAAIFIGSVEEDSSGYPDCRQSFYDAFQAAIDLGTKDETHIAIETPIIKLSKAEIVRASVELGVPLELTWSCYQNEDEACGVCDSCRLRLRGFGVARVKDPIKYKAFQSK